MNRRDLAELDRLLSSADAVVPMREIHAGAHHPDVIGLRHDVDDNRGSLDTALEIAIWESSRGYHSTFFLLHTASYWRRPDFLQIADTIEARGHEVGIHANAIAHALRKGGDPAEILHAAIEELRNHGLAITGVAPHGDELCHQVGFVNDEMFAECARPDVGAPDRLLEHDGNAVRLAPVPLAEFGLEYETYRLPRKRYLSDSGGSWNVPPGSIDRRPGQLHILWHPDWWPEAFDVEVE